MENYENEDRRRELDETQPLENVADAYVSNDQPSQPYSGAGVGRKESPFADSPYVMNHPQDHRHYQDDHMESPKTKKKKQGGKAGKRILAAALALAMVAGGCGITAALVNSRWEKKTEAMMDSVEAQMHQMQQQLDAYSNAATGNSVSGTVQLTGGMTPAQIYARNVKSVVLINCTISSSYYGQTVSGTSAGSGFVLTEDGYVVTNAHVVDGASKISVTMHDGTVHSAQLVGSDAANDVAVLKMDATDLQAVTLGSSDDLIVGDQVIAIGNPLGELTSTMTVGYVSAKDRDVTTDGTTINMIQTDAAINSGNSGGPMFNMKGEVVGITTAKYSGESSSGATIEGIGFAIPMDDVLGLISDLIDYGYVTGAYLGVMVSDMDAEQAAYFGIPVGARVEEVTPGYCAEEAGLQAKDIIVAVGDFEVGSVSDLTRALREFKAGDTTTITVYRSGGKLVLDITLDEKPQTTETQIPTLPENSQEMPDEGNFEEWYNYIAPFFGGGNG